MSPTHRILPLPSYKSSATSTSPSYASTAFPFLPSDPVHLPKHHPPDLSQITTTTMAVDASRRTSLGGIPLSYLSLATVRTWRGLRRGYVLIVCLACGSKCCAYFGMRPFPSKSRESATDSLAGYALLSNNALGERATILYFHRRFPQ